MMFVEILLFALVALCWCDLGVKNVNKPRKCVIACNSFQTDVLELAPFILNSNKAYFGEFPHMAALGYQDDITDSYNFQCSGSLISDSFILTAAHCVIRMDNKRPKIVRFGTVDLTDKTDGVGAQHVSVANIYPHENYSLHTRVNDIALVQLSKPVERNKNVRPICLFTEDSDPSELVEAGWGETGNIRDDWKFLLKTAVSAVSVKECNATLGSRKPIFETQFCAKSNDSIRDICIGNSGSPLQLEESTIAGKVTLASLVGVTSYGPTCGSRLPSIYTRVSKYLDWIEPIVWP